MSRIKQIIARETIDSRGNFTIETDVLFEAGALGPTDASARNPGTDALRARGD